MSKQNLKQNTHHAEPANEEIAALAYSFFEIEGRLGGHDLEHWLRAKQQLSKDCSSGNRSQKGGLASRDAKEKVFSVSDGKRSACGVA
jgi:hypothetical protein